MASCRDCLHHDDCDKKGEFIEKGDWYYDDVENECKYFADRTCFRKWISVKDRLPDEEQDVLLLIREIEFYGRHKEKRHVSRWIYTGWYIDGEWATTYCFGHKYISEEENDMWELAVTHWMPLPEIPINKEAERALKERENNG